MKGVSIGNLPEGPVTPGIRASMEQALLDTIPQDKRGVLLEVRGAEGEGLTFAVATRLGHGWAIQGDLQAWGEPGVVGRVVVAKVW